MSIINMGSGFHWPRDVLADILCITARLHEDVQQEEPYNSNVSINGSQAYHVF